MSILKHHVDGSAGCRAGFSVPSGAGRLSETFSLGVHQYSLRTIESSDKLHCGKSSAIPKSSATALFCAYMRIRGVSLAEMSAGLEHRRPLSDVSPASLCRSGVLRPLGVAACTQR